MRFKTAIALVFLTPVLGLSALRTTAQDGRWGDSATWQGGNIPGNGDTVSIYHTVTTSGAFIVGTSPAEGNVVMNLFSTGTVKIMSGSTLTVRGDITYTAGTGNTTDAVNVTAGGALEFDASQAASPSSQNYAFYPDNNFGWRKFTAIGVSSAPARVVSNSSGGIASLKTGGFAYVGGYTFTYAYISRLDFTMFYRDDNGTADPTEWNVTYTTFTGCGQITNSGGLHPDATFRHSNNTHINTASSNTFDFRIGYAKSNAGRRIISSSTFDASMGNNLGLKDFTVAGNFITDTFNALYSSSTWTKNFIRTSNDNISLGNITSSYFLIDADMSNPHLINVVNLNDAYDGNIFGHAGKNAGDCGEWVLGGGQATVSTFSVTRNIYVPNSEGYQSAEMTSMIASAGDSNSWLNYYFDFRHNTYFAGCQTSGNPFGAVDVSETANIGPGRLGTYKSNINYNPQLSGKRASYVKVLDVGNLTSNLAAGYGTGPTSNVCTASGCNYNASYGMSHTSVTASNTSTYLNQGRGYVANYTSTPGANDVDGTDPNFFDYTRNAERFDSAFYRPYMGLPAASAWASGSSYAIGDVVSHSSSTYYAGATINFRYVNKAGCSSSNPEPGVQTLSNWTNCWEFNTYQSIRDSIANGSTFTDSTIGASGADVIETLVRWVQYGYRPQASGLATAAHDGTTIGAMPALSAVGGRPTISPSTATVQTTKTIQFTSTNTVVWSLAPGSVGSIDSNGLFTAPSTVQNRNVFAGCPLVPDDAIWNVDITSLPVHPNSTTRVANVGAAAIAFEQSFPPNIYGTADVSASSMVFRYTTTQNGATYYFLPNRYRGVETNLYPNDYFAQDRHILGINTDTCRVQEVYNYYPFGTNTAECLSCNAQSGVQYGPMSYDLPAYDGGTDAAGMQVFPLALKYEELKAGQINHALRFTLSNSFHLQRSSWPATNFATAASCSNTTTCFEYGSRLRLKQSFSEAGFSTTAVAVIRALKKYGMFDSDGGITGHIQAMSNVASDTTTYNALFVEIPNSSLDFTDFEQVDESSLMVSTATTRVKYPNPYNATPNNFAIVVATNTVDNSTSTLHIAVQGVTVGTKNTVHPVNSGTLSVMAGMNQFSIPYWVNGSTQTAVTCSMTPVIGTLTSGCLYTPPSTQVGYSSAVVTITAVADSTAPATLALIVYPEDGIRIDYGGKAATISSPAIPYSGQDYGADANGKYWWAEPTGSLMQWYYQEDTSNPQASWGGHTDIGLWYTAKVGASDSVFSAVVPNGVYTLKLNLGRNSGTSSLVAAVETQGSIVLSSTSYRTLVGTTNYSPKISTHTVTVSDNTFYFALRYPDNSSKFNILNAFQLELESLAEDAPRKYIRGRSQLRGRGIFR